MNTKKSFELKEGIQLETHPRNACNGSSLQSRLEIGLVGDCHGDSKDTSCAFRRHYIRRISRGTCVTQPCSLRLHGVVPSCSCYSSAQNCLKHGAILGRLLNSTLTRTFNSKNPPPEHTGHGTYICSLSDDRLEGSCFGNIHMGAVEVGNGKLAFIPPDLGHRHPHTIGQH